VPTIADIRPAGSLSDLSIAKLLFKEYADSLSIDLNFQGFEEELSNLPGDYAAPLGTLLLAWDQDLPIGCVAIRPFEGPDVAELKRLFVRNAGRGMGVGLCLTLAALEFARLAGYEKIRLDTLPSMTSAQRLYASQGFREIEPYRFNPVPGTVFMELDLSRPST